jgi:hypothetical protein
VLIIKPKQQHKYNTRTVPTYKKELQNKKTPIIIRIIIITCTQTHIYKYIYTNAKSGNSWHMFNCKRFPKLHIRPPSLILLMIHPRTGEYFPAKAEK